VEHVQAQVLSEDRMTEHPGQASVVEFGQVLLAGMEEGLVRGKMCSRSRRRDRGFTAMGRFDYGKLC
jgi:hypothetical protein